MTKARDIRIIALGAAVVVSGISALAAVSFTTVAPSTGLNRSGGILPTPTLAQRRDAPPITATLVPSPIANGTAKQRGCRTGGIKEINRILPEWVSVEASDAPKVLEGIVRESHTATNDNPAFHVSHDWNADVLVDGAYNGLNSDANKVEDGERRMEIEWETANFPARFWPSPGDRTWMLGRWIFDCGHPPYQSEIHPPKAVAFTRPEPIIFPGDARPSSSFVTYVYLHGRGGYYKSALTGRNYEFDIQLPPRPGRFANLRTAILSLPFGGPSPTLQFVPNSNPPRLHVTYPLSGVSDPGNTRRFAAVIASAWQSPLTEAIGGTGYRTLRVTLDSIKINNDHDGTLSGSGEWRFWVRIGGTWLEIVGLSDVNGGDTVKINKSVELIVPDGGKFALQTSGWEDDCDSSFRSKDSDINLRDVSIGDLECEINGNDDIGILEREYAANNVRLGMYDESSIRNGDADTNKDFNLRYHIDLVKRFEPRSVVISPATPPTR